MSLTWISGTPTFSFMPKVRRQVSEHARDLALKIWQGAVDRTPVGSGELRASWNVSRGRPDYTTVGLPDSSPRSTGFSIPPPSVPILTAGPLGSAKYYVTNGKTYARHVEYGSSTIQPHLMLTRAVRAAK